MKKGFTLIELLIIVTLFVLLGVVTFVSLGSRRSEADITAATQQIGSLLRLAQSNAIAQNSDVPWGVYFSNSTNTRPFYALFTTSYSPANVVGSPYLLPTTVYFVTSTLASGATTSVTFAVISGAASASTTIGLYMPDTSPAFSSTISIASSGSVNY